MWRKETNYQSRPSRVWRKMEVEKKETRRDKIQEKKEKTGHVRILGAFSFSDRKQGKTQLKKSRRVWG